MVKVPSYVLILLVNTKVDPGSAPQAVIQANLVDPLEKPDMKITDVDICSRSCRRVNHYTSAGASVFLWPVLQK